MFHMMKMLFLASQLKIEDKSNVNLESQLSTKIYPKIDRNAGESCGILNGLEWTCQKDCGVTPYLMRKGWVFTCSGQESERVICCPRVDKLANYVDQTPKNISDQKCQYYQGQVCSSRSGDFFRHHSYEKPLGTSKKLRPNKASRIGVNRFNQKIDEENYDEIFDNDVEESTAVVQVYNGKEAEPGEFPYAALIGYGVKRSWLCGGTLISDRFVLSAAHCSEPDDVGPAKWVRLGDLDHSTEFDNVRPQDFFIVQRFLHPDYDEDLYYNEIVLFRLDHQAVFDQFVSPACLHRDPTDPPGTMTAVGWGRTERQKGPSSKLMKVELNLVAVEECNRRINNSKMSKENIPSGIDGRTMVCAWERDKDTCQGDSGGPLVITDSPHCLGQLVGITAFGPGDCDSNEVPGIYTRVSAFLPWLEPIVWPSLST